LQGIPADASVVLESTVAPGATEQYLVGKLPTNRIAYSPERIDPQPGKYYRMFDTAKMVASTDPVNREFLAELYQLAFREVCTFDNPRILELAKCFENTQRDMNIALMNELSIHCHSRGVPLGPVLNALSHKFNALPFHPGMVGGHCIAVDPYYLADWYEKNDLAYHAYSLPTYSRRTNETYIHYIANVIAGLSAGNPVLIVGRTYKPDVPDTRNSGALRLVSILHEHYGIQADTYDVLFEDSVPKGPYNVVIGAVNHRSGQGYSLRERLPVSKETAVFVNVGRFTHEQTQSFDRVITL
jgi:UDP-N-acetyl-D-galactosamine dehydrogenase